MTLDVDPTSGKPGHRAEGAGLRHLSEHSAAIASAAIPSIVSLEVARRGRRRRDLQATGVIVGGSIITNAHVVGRGTPPTISCSDDRRFRVRVRAVDRRTDLAVLEAPRGIWSDLSWGDSDDLRPGNLVWTIGNPMALGWTTSLGTLASTSRRLMHGNRTLMDGVLQTDSFVAPGSSGGALLNAAGELVGIIIANNVHYRGMAFAIPSAVAQAVVGDLVDHGFARRTFLGMQAKQVALRAATCSSLECEPRRAVGVVKVTPHGPAAAAGLLAGDLLLSADGRPLYGVYGLWRHLGARAAGRTVELQLLRRDKVVRAEIVPRLRGT